MPTNLPSHIQFGSSPPGIAHSSRFTGGVVAPQAGGARFNAPPDFQAPTYPSYTPGMVHPLAPILAAALSSGISGGVTPPKPHPPQISPYAPKPTQPVNLPGGGTFNPGTVYVSGPPAGSNNVGQEFFSPNPGPMTFTPGPVQTPQNDLAALLSVSKSRAYGF